MDVALEQLAEHHRYSLLEGSGISERVIAARGYRTATDPDELLELGFSKPQRRTPSLVIPVWGVDGRIQFYRSRPDDPRTDPVNRLIKYEQPHGTPVALDVSPLALDGLRDTTRRLWIVEGEKKADALVSREEVAIALLGVWSWKKDDWMLPDWEEVHLMNREVLIAFDSDTATNYQVRLAEDALAKALEGRTGYVG